MPKLTKRFVEATEVKGKPYFLFDELIPGFCIRTSPKGKRHYYFQYIRNRTRKRILLGQHGVMTAEQAREEAISKLNDVKAGADPHLDKTNKMREPLVKDVAQRFIDEHVMVNCKTATQDGYSHYLNKFIVPFFKNTKISEITRADVAALRHSMQHTPEGANRCIVIISKMFNLAEVWGLRAEGTNPCRHITKFPTKSRNRYLSKEEAKRLGDVLDELKQYPDENLAAVYCIQLLMLTGCRLGEIRTLKWEYIDYENEVIRLPDSKTGAKTVYVGNAVISLLQEIKQHPNRSAGNPYVIWGKKPDACINNIQSPWRRFRNLAGLDDLHIHDLRHSFASFAVNRGMSLPMIGKLLGHTQAQTTSRYAHLMAEPMKEAANSVTIELSQLLKVNTTLRNDDKQELQLETKTITGTTIKAPTYFTSIQAAEYLDVKPSAMVDWRYKKTGPSFMKKRGRIRYRVEALEEFMNDKSKQTQFTEELS